MIILLRVADFLIYFGVGMAIGSLTGLLLDVPFLWSALCVWLAVFMARIPDEP